MLIDATHPEETRVVVVDGNKVEDFDFESINKRQLAGNIYLAKVTRVEPSLQAAFVDYGGNRHGFLAFSEIHPDYYQIPVADREALIAEEAAAQERVTSREVADDEAAVSASRGSDQADKGKGRSRRRKRGGHGGERPEMAAGADGTVRGLEVIDLGEGEPDDPTASGAAPETLVPGTGDAVAGDGPDPDDHGEDGATDGTAPKSIAESAGLEDDSVSGEIGTPAKAATEPSAGEAHPVAPAIPERAGETAPIVDAVSAGGSGDDDRTGEGLVAAGSPEDTSGGPGAGERAPDGQQPTENAAPEGADRRRFGRRGRSRDRASPDDDAAAQATGEERPAAEMEQTVESIGDDLREEAAKLRARHRRRYKIQDVIKVRQIMLVQVVREERGNKGAALTTYLSLAGRYCVLMPNTARGGGISRKITSAGDRKRLREITDELDVPQGMGLIVRTAGAERTRAEIKRDYEFLIRQWDQIRELTLKSIAPTLIYEEGSLIKRSIRDLYSKEIDTILVEGDTGYREAKDYMKMLMPSHAKNVQQYAEPIPLFIRYQVESYLNGMFNPVVQLKSGGYIVIGVTEALVAIDVNSGRSTRESSIEETALKTNLEAADEVSRQLRLRDLAGLIVIDFIDMEDNRNNRAVEKRMKDRLKTDRARIQVGRISPFGLMEMSRQRLRPGMLEATTQPCPHCHGRGLIRSDENMALSILREIEEEGVRGRSTEITIAAPVDIANYLINAKRAHLGQIEQRYGISVSLLGDPGLTSPEYRLERSRSSAQRNVPAPARDHAVTAEKAAAAAPDEDADLDADGVTEEVAAEDAPAERDEGRSRRRRGRRGGQRRRHETGAGEPFREATAPATAPAAAPEGGSADGEGRSGRRSRRRRRGRRGDSEPQARHSAAEAGSVPSETPQDAERFIEPMETGPMESGPKDSGPQVPALSERPSAGPGAERDDADQVGWQDLAGSGIEDGPDAAEDRVGEEPAALGSVALGPVALEPVELEPLPAAAAPAEPVTQSGVTPPGVAAQAPDVPAEGPPQPRRRGWWQRG